jgi:hypothetical protein
MFDSVFTADAVEPVRPIAGGPDRREGMSQNCTPLSVKVVAKRH